MAQGHISEDINHEALCYVISSTVPFLSGQILFKEVPILRNVTAHFCCVAGRVSTDINPETVT